MLASIFAVYELLKEGLLDVNVIFLVEGEEENGSVGFQEAVSANKVIAKVYTYNSYLRGGHLGTF